MKKINPELWLLLFLVLIAAMVNFLVSSQNLTLLFYFLPVLYSAYHFGRRHATMTAIASVALVVLLTYFNPVAFTRRVEMPYAAWFDLAGWGGVLMLSGYTMGMLYERNQKNLQEMKNGYDGMLVILQHFLSNEKYSDAHSYRVSMYATEIAEALGLDSGSVEDIRTAALLHNVSELGISNEMLSKAANVTQAELDRALHKRGKSPASRAKGLSGSLHRVIPILLAEQQLMKASGVVTTSPFEVQVLAMADEYESLISGRKGRKLPPTQAEEVIVKSSGTRYDSMIVNAFVKAFGRSAKGAETAAK